MSACLTGSAGALVVQDVDAAHQVGDLGCGDVLGHGLFLLAASGSLVAFAFRGAQPEGVGAGLDDVGVEGEPVDDGGAEAGVGEGAVPLGEGGVGGDRDAGAFLAFGENLEEQFRAAAVEFEVAELVEAEQVDAAVAGDGA